MIVLLVFRPLNRNNPFNRLMRVLLLLLEVGVLISWMRLLLLLLLLRSWLLVQLLGRQLVLLLLLLLHRDLLAYSVLLLL